MLYQPTVSGQQDGMLSKVNHFRRRDECNGAWLTKVPLRLEITDTNNVDTKANKYK